ncbi:MAG: TIGR00266 family protein [Agarilytica sp.]
MSEEIFNVVLTGKLVNSVSQEDAIAGFAKLFKLPLEKAKTTFAKAPVTIKKNVDNATGAKFIQALQKSGIESKLESVSETPSSTPSPTAAPDVTPAATEAAGNSTSQTEPEHQDTQEQPGYAFTTCGKPDYAFVNVEIPANQMLKVEASAMATMDTNIRMKTKLRGGFGRLLTGENIFINEFTAEEVSGEVGIAPGTPGDLRHEYLDNQSIFLQNSAFVACGPDVEVETKWQGLVKGFFSGESLFLIKASGKGDLWFNSYGAIIEIDVTDDYVVDTGNIVAFTEGLEYNITKVGGYKSLFFSGEGFVCRFSGQGKVWIQTRGTAAFVSWAHWFRPVKNKG